ncbi:hypothetical protein GEMRC1_007818 [Eukaryota sp. GEM-RC1]
MKLFLIATVLVVSALCAGHIELPFNGDEFCRSLDDASYCKTWLHVPVCQGSDIPCGGDAFCQSLAPGSYCKFWLHVPVCQGIDVPCGPHIPEMTGM